jgi:hypothetical protein
MRDERDQMLEELACKFGRAGSVSKTPDKRSKVSYLGRKEHTRMFRRNTNKVAKTRLWPANSLWNPRHEAETYQ